MLIKKKTQRNIRATRGEAVRAVDEVERTQKCTALLGGSVGREGGGEGAMIGYH